MQVHVWVANCIDMHMSECTFYTRMCAQCMIPGNIRTFQLETCTELDRYEQVIYCTYIHWGPSTLYPFYSHPLDRRGVGSGNNFGWDVHVSINDFHVAVAQYDPVFSAPKSTAPSQTHTMTHHDSPWPSCARLAESLFFTHQRYYLDVHWLHQTIRYTPSSV